MTVETQKESVLYLDWAALRMAVVHNPPNEIHIPCPDRSMLVGPMVTLYDDLRDCAADTPNDICPCHPLYVQHTCHCEGYHACEDWATIGEEE